MQILNFVFRKSYFKISEMILNISLSQTTWTCFDINITIKSPFFRYLHLFIQHKYVPFLLFKKIMNSNHLSVYFNFDKKYHTHNSCSQIYIKHKCYARCIRATRVEKMLLLLWIHTYVDIYQHRYCVLYFKISLSMSVDVSVFA